MDDMVVLTHEKDGPDEGGDGWVIILGPQDGKPGYRVVAPSSEIYIQPEHGLYEEPGPGLFDAGLSRKQRLGVIWAGIEELWWLLAAFAGWLCEVFLRVLRLGLWVIVILICLIGLFCFKGFPVFFVH